MRRGAATWVLFILLANALMVSGVGGADGAGSGESGRGASRATTLIYNVYDLQNMGLDLKGSYELARDIDASGTKSWNNGAGFVPVGNKTRPFNGTLDGKGYNISGLFINRPTTDYVGLFGCADKGSLVNDAGVVNMDVTGRDNVGGLLGSIVYGTVNNSYATGNVRGARWTGGLVGYNFQGAVNNSDSAVHVTGSYEVGGIAGASSGGVVDHCHAAGNLSGTWSIGGLVGSGSSTTVKDSYFTGNVSGTSYVGGLVGDYEGIYKISNSHYNIDDVSINGGHHITVGGLFDAQYQDFFANDLSLDISDYGSVLVPAGGYFNMNNVTGLRALLGFAEISGYRFRLVSDLDLSNDPGLYIPYLAAVFDGDNHTMSNQCLKLPFVACLGMFGFNHAGTIMNTGIVNDQIEGYEHVGGLVGYNTGAVNNSYATGNVAGNGSVGGLVGFIDSRGTVVNSSASGNVAGDQYIGGLVGYNDFGVVSNSQAKGNVSGRRIIGGLVGINTGALDNSYATGSVSGTGSVGGLVGLDLYGKVRNSYATGNVNGTGDDVGGLVGRSVHGTVGNSYATGNVNGTGYAGGLVGCIGDGYPSGSVVSNSYATGNVSGDYDVGGLVGYTDRGIVNNSYAMGYVTGTDYIGGLVGDGYGSVINSYATGNVKGDDHVGGLVGNFAGTVNNSYATGTVIGDHDVGGLAGSVNDGSLKNSHATGNVTGTDYTGGLVGSLIFGDVMTSYATGNVTGTDFAGGLVGAGGVAGHSYGRVITSFATGNVKGENYVGGLIGNNAELVSNSYAMGYVTGTDCVGGLVGYSIGMVINCYATGYVTGTDCVGGLVGNNSDVVLNCFWDNETSGQCSSWGGTGKTTAEMKTRSTFTNAEWDFNNVWSMIENTTYPVFKWQDILSTIADAGIDQTVHEDTVVTFNGSGSSDHFGITNYTWTFRDGEPRSIYGVGPSYEFRNPGIFNVELKVTNVFGFWNIDTTIITVIDTKPPVSDAGPDRTVDEGTLVTFNGSGSSTNVGIVNYTWTFTDGSPVTLYGIQSEFLFVNPGIFVVTLNVTDARGNWDIDTMNVTVIDTRPPVADAGPDLAVDEGTPVTFDGSASTGNAMIVNYSWEFFDGASVTLFGIRPVYRFDDPGIFVVTLKVSDVVGQWYTDTLTVTVNDITAPVADAGSDRTVDNGTVVTVDGSASSDNVGVVDLAWTFTDGGPVMLYGAHPTYKFDNPGIFVVTLTVMDAAGNRGTDTMTVTVRDITAPVADAGPDRMVDERTQVAFDGTASSDNVGIVNYTWTFDYGTRTVVLYGVSPSFTFIIPGVYHVVVNASDAAGSWSEDAMTLTVRDITPPVANAGRDQRVLAGRTMVFNGSLSKDNHIIGKYYWNFTYNGKAQSLDGENVSFRFDKAGIYEIILTVIDEAGNRGEDRVVVTVEPAVDVDEGGLRGLLWMPALMIALAVAGLAGYLVMRKRKAVIPPPPEGGGVSRISLPRIPPGAEAPGVPAKSVKGGPSESREEPAK